MFFIPLRGSPAGSCGQTDMLLVTGGAGFIGSNVVAALNDAGRADVAVCDVLGQDGKWRNLAKRQLADIVPPAELAGLAGRPPARCHHPSRRHFGDHGDRRRSGDRDQFPAVDAAARLVHGQRARRSSMPRRRRPMATARRVSPTMPRSPALKRLRPMNLYGWSKHLFDMAVAERAASGEKLPPQWAGLKFFNVFGPNEYHKGDDDERAGAALRRHQGRPAGAAVQVASRRHRRRRSAPRFHLCRRRGAR